MFRNNEQGLRPSSSDFWKVVHTQGHGAGSNWLVFLKAHPWRLRALCVLLYDTRGDHAVRQFNSLLQVQRTGSYMLKCAAHCYQVMFHCPEAGGPEVVVCACALASWRPPDDVRYRES